MFELKFVFNNGLEKNYYLNPDAQAETIFQLSKTINNFANEPCEFWGFIDKDGSVINIRLKELLLYTVRKSEEIKSNP